ncbi:MAG: response regulator [Methyloprofundus sp.]|nr:response regulator [Methyloprofundus sp.]
MITKPNILIIDDLAENLKLLVEVMNSKNYSIRPAINGQQALIAVKSMPPDLILLDINMPGMDGFEVCRRLKKFDQTKNIPIIFLSAKNSHDDIVKGLNLGAVDYITKPFDTAEVLLRVKLHLDLKFSKEEIIQKNNEQKELLHILCHDLMNSVGVVQSFLRLKEFDVALSEDEEYMMMAINNSVDTIDLVRKMRCIEEEKVSIRTVPSNLNKMVQTSCAIVKNKFSDKNIELVIDLSDDLIVMVEEVSFVNSVLNNLLTNALKFSYADSQIIIRAQLIKQTVNLVIQDFGVGMSQELSEDMFKMEKSTTRPGTSGELGTGFGMPLVKKFIQLYGGEIKVLSQKESADNPAHGTEVILSLKNAI